MHKKHADLQKPALGKFARHEVALMGTTCEVIAQWAGILGQALRPANVVYADANHHPNEPGKVQSKWTDNQHSIALELPAQSAIIDRHLALAQADLVIVNGNHFEAEHQIIICNPDKEASLRKRAAQLTHVVAIITTDVCQSVPEFVKELLPHWANIPVFNQPNIGELVPLIQREVMPAPPMKALIMAGGKSVRMGRDKTHIDYHGLPQYAYLATLCKELNIPAHLSCRNEQATYFEEQGYSVIPDRITQLGPLGGIASAFMSDPNAAWLILACDVPFLDKQVLSELMQQRTHSHTATAFKSPFDQFPEPLIAIWEPKAFPLIMQFISLGYSCPRKVLIQSGAKVIDASSPEKLENINTPDELEDALQLLRKNS
ncbi:MAG: NTP transferase domain-containing protein [Flavobacteriales bacterium]|jgi:molybdopterin-guanine dinucleotide biosynthesis protein A